MARLPIRIYGDPVLRKKAVEILEITPEICQLADDMIETMYDAVGIGLAAPQVGKLARMIVVDPAEGYDDVREAAPTLMLNPTVVDEGDEDMLFEEGCLSIPDINGDVNRPSTIRVEYTDILGVVHVIEAEELFCRVIQHEIDHLDGVLFVDRVSAMTRRMLDKELKLLVKAQKEGLFA